MRFKDTDPKFRSCYSNTTLLKMNDWSVCHKNKTKHYKTMIVRLMCKYIVSYIGYQVHNIAMQVQIIPVFQTSRSQSDSGWIIHEYVKISFMMHGWRVEIIGAWSALGYRRWVMIRLLEIMAIIFWSSAWKGFVNAEHLIVVDNWQGPNCGHFIDIIIFYWIFETVMDMYRFSIIISLMCILVTFCAVMHL